MYRIIDEPTESPLRQFAVGPFWPWFALSLVGAWLGVPWLIFNAIAIGSPTKGREIALALATPVLMVLAFLAAELVLRLLGVELGSVDERVGWALLPLQAVKVIVGYVLFTWQSRAAQLHAHFGHALKNGIFLVLIGRYFTQHVIDAAPGILILGLLWAKKTTISSSENSKTTRR